MMRNTMMCDERYRYSVRHALWYGRLGLWAALLLVAVGPGCGAGTRGPEPLANAVRLYNDGVRWERFDQAAQKRPFAQRDDFLDERDQVHEDLRIHDYEVVRVRYGPQRLRARVHVKYSWYLNSRGVVRETHAVQRWEQQESLWIVTGETRLRGAPMPGLPEPEDSEDSEDSVEEPAIDLPGEDSGALPAESP
jgi:hypothetical protein